MEQRVIIMIEDDWNNYNNEVNICYGEDQFEPTNLTDKIKDKSQGCYTWEIG